jgi:sporulation protein YqfC
LPKGRNSLISVPDNAEVKRLDKKMNGSIDGIIVVTQSLMPSLAPNSAVFVSIINISMQTDAARPVRIPGFIFHHLGRIYASFGKNITVSSYAFEKGGFAMGSKRNFIDRIATAVDLQDEPIPGMPLVEIAGERRVLIENHRGVLEYGTERIRVKVKFGHVCVCGSGLELARMNRGQLVISGVVNEVQLIRGRC